MGGRREEGGVLGHNLDMRPEPEPEPLGARDQSEPGRSRDRRAPKWKKHVLGNTFNIE